MFRHLAIFAAVALVATSAGAQTQAFRDEAAADAQVIESLRAHGSDLTKPHPTRYYFYFKDEQSARAASTELEQQGFKLERLGLAPKKNEWLVLTSKPTIPSLPVVSAITSELNALARKHSGVYDGWEAAVTK